MIEKIKQFWFRNKEEAEYAATNSISASTDLNDLFVNREPITMTFKNASLETSGEDNISYPKEIKITQLDKGFIVECGCKKLSFQTLLQLVQAVELYYTDPKKAEKKYIK
jgi:hypothetical protein